MIKLLTIAIALSACVAESNPGPEPKPTVSTTAQPNATNQELCWADDRAECVANGIDLATCNEMYSGACPDHN